FLASCVGRNNHRLTFAAGDLAMRPTHRLVSLDCVSNCLKLALFIRALGAALEIISPFHQQSVQCICDRWCWRRAVGRVHPVAGGERIAELLELPDRCNALLVDGAHIWSPKGVFAVLRPVRCRGAFAFIPAKRTLIRYTVPLLSRAYTLVPSQ